MWLLLTFRYKIIECGSSTYIGYNVEIRPDSISIGENCFIGPRCWLASKIQMGNYVMLAGRVAIVGGDHRFDIVGTPTIESGRAVNKMVVIHDDVWIGHGAIILHGVTIGEGAIVAAGSTVSKDVAPYSIVAGVPARELRKRFDGDGIIKHRDFLSLKRKESSLIGEN